MVLGLLPENLDHVELRTVGRKVAQEDLVLSHPAPGDIVVQSMMDFGVIEHNEGRHRQGCGDPYQKIIDKSDERLPLDRTGDLLVVKPLTGKVKRPHDRDTLMVSRRDWMRLPHRGPSALYRGRGRETGFVVVEQLALPLTRQFFDTGKSRLAGGKSYGLAVFFRLNRVRLKLNPWARRWSPRVSSTQGSGQ